MRFALDDVFLSRSALDKLVVGLEKLCDAKPRIQGDSDLRYSFAGKNSVAEISAKCQSIPCIPNRSMYIAGLTLTTTLSDEQVSTFLRESGADFYCAHRVRNEKPL